MDAELSQFHYASRPRFLWGRVREHPMDLARVQEVRVHHGFVFDRLSLRSGGTTVHVYLFRDRRPSLEALRQRLDEARAGVPVHA